MNRLLRAEIPLILIALLSSTLACPASANAEEKKQLCIFQIEPGKYVQVNGADAVPKEHKADARCVDASASSFLAKPQDIQLQGNIRVEDINSSLGRVQLRWPRSAETLFGRTPLRAVTDAATTISRAIRTSGFPTSVQSLKVDWQIVFMDETLPETQIPKTLISNCHPGWMTPPANIYIVAQRISAGCSGGRPASASVADSELTRVLLHEMGHVLEYHLLKDNYSFDRMRSEGFATWFETYAAQYSSIVSSKDLKKDVFAVARLALKQNPGPMVFQGTQLDYARASLYFFAVVDRLGIRGLMDVYQGQTKDSLSFFDSIKKNAYWDQIQLEKEILKEVSKN